MRILFFIAALMAAVTVSQVSQANTLPHQDAEFGCFDHAKADRYVRDYSIDVESFGGLELCDPAKDTKKLFNDLHLIENSQFQPGREHSFIKGFVARDNYYSWMKSQTRGVNRGHDIPYATAYNSWGYFTMQDGWATLSTLGRVGTIIHEARHTAGYSHYRCTFGPYASSSVSGCDTHYGQAGSHGVEMEYYARVVLEAKNLHPVYQSMARLMLLGRSNFVFNQMPLQKREALLGLSGDRLVLIDGTEVIERPLPRVEGDYRLKRTSFGASLVQGERAVALDLYKRDDLGFNTSDDYSYYKLFQTPRAGRPRSLRDTEEMDVGNLRYFLALDEQGKVFSYNFPQGDWHPASAAATDAASFVTRSPAGQAGIFVVKADGTVLPFNPANRQFGAALKDRWNADTAAFAMLGSSLVRLTSEGAVVDSSTGAPVEALTKYRFRDLVNVPMYDTFQVAR